MGQLHSHSCSLFIVRHAPPQPWASTDLLSGPGPPFQECHRHQITQYTAFWCWLALFSIIMPLRRFMLFCVSIVHSFFIAREYSTTGEPPFFYPFVFWKHLGCCQLGMIMNKAAQNFCVCFLCNINFHWCRINTTNGIVKVIGKVYV